ncbi:helix-turn-helix transcriptional regulator [Konateibacter massiliensis]|uniref:helix-turn-helix transcriptional regulator n=1 Tax=Konateibacter massiliensis TaxID=2002841 RepID=UPI000C14D5B5|nr:helix-turn-helix transcriptional regulator [Konateibacter massiliensis]
MSISLLPLKLIELRKQHDYTQEYVSSYIHISRGGYSQYETGKRVPSTEALLKLAELYNISVNQLINPQIISVSDSLLADSSGEYPSTNKIDVKMLKDLGILLLNSTPFLSPDSITQNDINFLSNYKNLSPSDQEDIRLFVSCKYKNMEKKKKKNISEE